MLPTTLGFWIGYWNEDTEIFYIYIMLPTRFCFHYSAFLWFQLFFFFQHLRAQYEELFPTLSDHFPEVFSPELYTWEQFLWACELWYSNSMKVIFPNGKLRTCLIPVAGFLNHSVIYLSSRSSGEVVTILSSSLTRFSLPLLLDMPTHNALWQNRCKYKFLKVPFIESMPLRGTMFSKLWKLLKFSSTHFLWLLASRGQSLRHYSTRYFSRIIILSY